VAKNRTTTIRIGMIVRHVNLRVRIPEPASRPQSVDRPRKTSRHGEKKKNKQVHATTTTKNDPVTDKYQRRTSQRLTWLGGGGSEAIRCREEDEPWLRSPAASWQTKREEVSSAQDRIAPSKIHFHTSEFYSSVLHFRMSSTRLAISTIPMAKARRHRAA